MLWFRVSGSGFKAKPSGDALVMRLTTEVMLWFRVLGFGYRVTNSGDAQGMGLTTSGDAGDVVPRRARI